MESFSAGGDGLVQDDQGANLPQLGRFPQWRSQRSIKPMHRACEGSLDRLIGTFVATGQANAIGATRLDEAAT
ncbi:MAG: hypothetical protein HKN47_23505 [Pirellulaceae bacterium]|nr:hypothetical protein [Pirellulaceae bacterium]